MRGLHFVSFVFLTLVASLVVDVAATEFRIWEDATGRFRTEAQFISLQGSNVQLKRKDGILISVPLDKFSRADQEFARRQSLPPSPTGGKFPRAVTELPDWLVQDCPFNAREFWITVPSNQNAAPLYLDALYEFVPEVEAYFPPEVRPERTPAAERRADRSRQLQRDWNAYPQPKRDPAERDAVLLEHVAAFEKLAEAQKRTSCVFEIGWDVPSYFPLLLASREVVRIAQLQVERDVERKDFDSVLRMIDLSLRLSRDLRPRAPMSLQYLADALDSVVVENVLKPALKSPALTTDQCDALLRLLVQHATAVNSLSPFLTGLRGGYLSKRAILHDLEQQTDEFAETRYREAFGIPHETRGAVLFSAFNGTQRDRDAFGTAPPPGMALLTPIVSAMKPANFASEVAVLNERYELLSAAANQPYAVRVTALSPLIAKCAGDLNPRMEDCAPPPNTPREQADAHIVAAFQQKLSVETLRGPYLAMILFIMGSNLEQSLGSGNTVAPEVIPMTKLEAAKALVALRRWYGTHTNPPPDFATLCRAAGLADLPRDYFGDGPLRMISFAADTPIQHRFQKDLKAVAGETIIYSVGPDGVDDKATKDGDGRSGGDFLFRLEIPQSELPATR